MAKKQSDEEILKAAIEKIRSDFGSGSLMSMGDKSIKNVESISTGSLKLDNALGVGGFPRGRIIEILGPESTGKTTLALHSIAEAQKKGFKYNAIIDAEHALNIEYVESLGIDRKNTYISQPDSGEEALSIADDLIKTGKFGVIVIDSVAALTPRAELEGDIGDANMALQARMMSQALRMLTGSVNKTGTILVFINQYRTDIKKTIGSKDTPTGGKALRFYASVRVDLRRISTLKFNEDPIGMQTQVSVIKNKVSPPFKKAIFDLMFGRGISKSGEVIDLGIENGLIKKSGSWFSYGDLKLGHGRESVRSFLNDNLELRNEIEIKIIDTWKD